MPFGRTRRLVGQYRPPVALIATLILAWEALVRWLAFPCAGSTLIRGAFAPDEGRAGTQNDVTLFASL